MSSSRAPHSKSTPPSSSNPSSSREYEKQGNQQNLQQQKDSTAGSTFNNNNHVKKDSSGLLWSAISAADPSSISSSSARLQPKEEDPNNNNNSGSDWMYANNSATSSYAYDHELSNKIPLKDVAIVAGDRNHNKLTRMSNDSLVVCSGDAAFDGIDYCSSSSSSSSSSSKEEDNDDDDIDSSDDNDSDSSSSDDEEELRQQLQRINNRRRGSNTKYSAALSDDGGSYHGDMILTDSDDDSSDETDDEAEETDQQMNLLSPSATVTKEKSSTFPTPVRKTPSVTFTRSASTKSTNSQEQEQQQKPPASSSSVAEEKKSSGILIDFPSLSKRKFVTMDRVKRRMPRRLSDDRKTKKDAAAAAYALSASYHSVPSTPTRSRLSGGKAAARKMMTFGGSSHLRHNHRNKSHSDGEKQVAESEFSSSEESSTISKRSSISGQSVDLLETPHSFPEGYVPSVFYMPSSSSKTTSKNNNDDYDSSSSSLALSLRNNETIKESNNNFLNTYFDKSVLSEGKMSINLLSKFASEHQILIRAITQLLAERDHVGVEANIDDPHTMKSGTLKKSVGYIRGSVWKTRYCEVRKGFFTYYEDTNSFSSGTSAAEFAARAAAATGGGSSSSVTRRNIPLRSSLCTCRAVTIGKLKPPKKSRSSGGGGGGSDGDGGGGGGSGILGGNGYAFELRVEGGPKRLWMAKTKEERQAWIHIIHEAMIGPPRGVSSTDAAVGVGGVRKDSLLALSNHKDDLEKYLRAQSKTRTALTKEQYMSGLSNMWGDTVSVPVRWIKEQVESPVISGYGLPSDTKNNDEEEHNLMNDRRSSALTSFWEDMMRESFSINGYVLRGDSKYGPERIVGALSRCILEFDKSAIATMKQQQQESEVEIGGAGSYSTPPSPMGEQSPVDEMSEVQAISYARDILLACNRILRNDDSYLNVEALCSNPDLVVLCPKESVRRPLRISVSHSEIEHYAKRRLESSGSAIDHQEHEGKSGWITLQDRSHRSRKNMFFILSQDILSYYEKEHPIPQGLRGHIALPGAALEIYEINDGEGGNEFLKKVLGGSSSGGGIGGVANKAREAYRRSRSVGHGLASRYIACLVLHDQSNECVLCFCDRSNFVAWRDALQLAISTFSPPTNLMNSSFTSPHASSAGHDSSEMIATMSTAESGTNHCRQRSDPSPHAFELEVPHASPTPNLYEQSGRKNITGLNFLRNLNRKDSGPSQSTDLPSPPETPPATPRSTSRDVHSGGKFFGRSGGKERTWARHDSMEEQQIRNLAVPDMQGVSQGSTSKHSRAGKRTSLLSSLPKRRNTNIPSLMGQTNSASVEFTGQPLSKPTVCLVVKGSTVYKVCTADPTGDETIDTWATLETKVVLSFLLSGGPTGRILHGEELVEINLMEGLVTDENIDKFF